MPPPAAVVPRDTKVVDWERWSIWAEDFLIPRIVAFVRHFGPNSLPDPKISEKVFEELSDNFKDYNLGVNQVTFLRPLPTYPTPEVPLPDFTPVRVQVPGVALLTKSVPISPWPGSPAQPRRNGLVLLSPQPSKRHNTVAGPRCIEAFEVAEAVQHNYGVAHFMPKFADGRLDKVSQHPFTSHPLNGDRWHSKTTVSTEAISEWSVHLDGWRGEIEIIFVPPLNPHQVVAR